MQVYRNTPINGCAPAQPAMSRLLRSTLPTSRSVLQPCVVNAKPDLQERQQRTKCFYDRVATTLKPLTSGDVVRVQRKWGWDPAIVQYIHDSPHSYVVRHEGGELRRNRRHLRRTLKQLPLFVYSRVGRSLYWSRRTAVAKSRSSAAASSRCSAVASSRCSAAASSRCSAVASTHCSAADRSRCSAAARSRC